MSCDAAQAPRLGRPCLAKPSKKHDLAPEQQQQQQSASVVPELGATPASPR